MSQIYHSNIVTTVNRIGPGRIIAQTILLSSAYEAAARMILATDSFIISEAAWDIYRSPGRKLNGSSAASPLVGQEAYFSIGPALRAVGRENGELPRELLADCVKGVIQAETHLFGERGFPSAAAYDDFWRDNYRNSCRRYSSDEGIAQSWFEFVADRKAAGDCLFTRCKTASVHAMADGTLSASASFIDSYHELSLFMTSAAGVITGCSAELVRVPHTVCRETLARLAALRGQAVDDINGKAAAESVGGALGCNHLVDLVYHTAKTLRQSQDGQ
ncbi:MAG: DUF2889 domain-containing protein [Negativicutes bacterium]|nr:DUF2889 domain-containing protein [Negativicutes bacterium]